MSFIPVSGILYANENFDSTENVQDDQELISEDIQDETELVEVSDTLSQGEEKIETAETAVDGLETIADRIETINEESEEGIDETTAELVETAVESLLQTAKIGVTFKQLGLPSTESFSNKKDRKELGKATVEGIRETAKKIWAAIVSAIQKSIEWLKQLFTKIFYSAERLKKRAKAVIRKAERVGGDPKEKEIEDFSLLKSVCVGTKVATPSDLADTTKIISDVLEYQKKMVKISADASEEFKKVQGKSSILDKIKETLKKTGNTISSSNFLKDASDNIKKQITADNDLKVTVSKPTVGNDVYYVINGDPKSSLPNTAEESIKFCSNSKAGCIKVAADIKSGTKLPVLKPEVAIKFAKETISLADTILKYKSLSKEIEEAKKKFLDTAKENQKNQDSADVKNDELTRAILGRLRRIIDEPARSASVYGVRSGYAVMNYSSRSLALYQLNK